MLNYYLLVNEKIDYKRNPLIQNSRWSLQIDDWSLRVAA
jgi:hypothetical protein